MFCAVFDSHMVLADVRVSSQVIDPYTLEVRLELDASDALREVVKTPYGPKIRYVIEGAYFGEAAGGLEIPEITRWIEVTAHARPLGLDWLDAQDTSERPIVGAHLLEKIDLAQLANRQPMRKESESPLLEYRVDSHSVSEDLRKPWVIVGTIQNLAGRSVIPLTFRPIRYSLPSQSLMIKTEIRARLKFDTGGGQALVANAFSDLSRESSARLMESASDSRMDLFRPRGNMMIVVSPMMRTFARRIASLHPEVRVIYHEPPSTPSPEALHKAISDIYRRDGLEAVLLFGSDQTIPMKRMGYDRTPSDAYYSYVDGDDSLADVVIGRIPTEDPVEADIYVRKVESYLQLRRQGVRSKRVMLVAHAEGYPDKYSRNIGEVQSLSNVRGFSYEAFHGGMGATTADIIESLAKGFSLVLYRGHGKTDRWDEWDYRGDSLTSNDVFQFKNIDAKMSVVFNIACNTGDLSYSNSLAESLLFVSPVGGRHRGAVAVLASTRSGYTAVNDLQSKALFNQIQQSGELTIGQIIALANNQVMRDTNAAPATMTNVSMYVLYGDPLVVPWFE